MPSPDIATAQDHTRRVIPGPSGWQIAFPDQDRALTWPCNNRPGQWVGNGAVFRVGELEDKPVNGRRWHVVHAVIPGRPGTTAKEHEVGFLVEGGDLEAMVAEQVYDDPFGYELRVSMLPVADIDPCRCLFSSGRCNGCGARASAEGWFGDTEAAGQVRRDLYGEYSDGTIPQPRTARS
ncbi:hypothetical protein ACFC1T_09150 [Kitasatospora sp. NPDC056076]|uniref:hypothetical protein n=1 Tax=Streptomycetaceae TaxID=2062 RepID=UPI0035DBACF2